MANRGQAVAVALVVGVFLLPGCSFSPPPTAPASPDPLTEFEGEAFLLMMADRLLFEPLGVGRIYRERADLHEQLAVTLGRVGDARGLRYLEALAADPDVSVRRAAVFSLGLLESQSAYPALLAALGDADRKVGSLAVDGLARIGTSLARVLPGLDVLQQDEKLARLLPRLFRFGAAEIDAYVTELEASDGRVPESLERWLVYALGRSGGPGGVEKLRQALSAADSSQDVWVRGWAARGLGRLGDRTDLDRLAALLTSPDTSVVVQALRAGTALVAGGRAKPTKSWTERLLQLADDSRPWVRLSALEAAGHWPADSSMVAALRRSVADGGRAAELALVSWARADAPGARAAVERAAASDMSGLRRSAAAGAALLGVVEVVRSLVDDSDPSVRATALQELLALGGQGAQVAAREALLEPDPVVRAISLGWLSENPVAPIDELLLAMTPDAEDFPELGVYCSRALLARGLEEPLERGAVVAALERFAAEVSPLVRRAANVGLVALDRPEVGDGTVAARGSLRVYSDMVQSTRRPRAVELVTTRGSVQIALDCSTTPLTCLSFLQLTAAGFFDGVPFHRVIPDFVAQGGDPRGDGWGGPGFSLRDENSPTEFERGVVGMARSDTHTAGSQFFLTLSHQPHLSGRYTAFGRVQQGMAVVDQIEQGDVIVRAREVGSSDDSGTSLR